MRANVRCGWNLPPSVSAPDLPAAARAPVASRFSSSRWVPTSRSAYSTFALAGLGKAPPPAIHAEKAVRRAAARSSLASRSSRCRSATSAMNASVMCHWSRSVHRNPGSASWRGARNSPRSSSAPSGGVSATNIRTAPPMARSSSAGSSSAGNELLLRSVRRRFRRLRRLRLPDAVLLPPATHRPRGPPVRPAEQRHRRRNQQCPDNRRVDQQRDEHANADELHEHEARGGKRADDHSQQQGGAGDDPAGLLHTCRHRQGVVAGQVPLLTDPGQQEDLVVHREAEKDREHQDRLGGVEEPRRLEAEQTLQVSVAENPGDHTWTFAVCDWVYAA